MAELRLQSGSECSRSQSPPAPWQAARGRLPMTDDAYHGDRDGDGGDGDGDGDGDRKTSLPYV